MVEANWKSATTKVKARSDNGTTEVLKAHASEMDLKYHSFKQRSETILMPLSDFSSENRSLKTQLKMLDVCLQGRTLL